ncbi:ATP-binding protein [Streptomonospora salina]|uniref:Anti-sigma regulatory factor (Ser/Thr protein kinase) n=1 Tax=Streptomonospora salina TaxID=104205 RepID=A0A841ECP6_9ACTN|nr:ATP-binding protein [Streptomonospora salina]MBB6000174.1 anti-sigma regulatory factor (Ser/Thr protein kinase) [Streptomonospora salina]
MSSTSLNGSAARSLGRPAYFGASSDSASVDFLGIPDSVALVRQWTRQALTGGVLTEGERDDVVLAASELATNAIHHSASGLPGGVFAVRLQMSDVAVRIEVEDQGGPGTPQTRPGHHWSEGGRGLVLVAAVMDAWGPLGHGSCGAWAEVHT